MLVTDTSWAEFHPVRRALADPYQAWRCVGWTSETMNFLIVASPGARSHVQLPDGWLVGGPEALLEATAQMEKGSFSVYVVGRATDDGNVSFDQVTGIWRERNQMGDVPSFWYAIGGGEPQPCSRFRRRSEALPELVSELIIDARAVSPQVNR
ncbi:hypothetical protein [Paraburkholderia haematera]|uniref:Uncharacterized protein n=1 Tax=Paraburkholderia haematera TaxID=2793077 RepID=A0ABN7N1K9_9BURK|nr:hypothetical protein [Paraburkholderia haematera]CAE6829451.1 hypothetical protein R69888_06491 [Paraburkholderia haematera]